MNTPPLDIRKARISAEFKHPSQLFRARFSPCGKVIAAIGVDTAVHLWTIEDKTKKSFQAHKTWVSSMCFNSSGNDLYTADYHGVIHCAAPLGAGRIFPPACCQVTGKSGHAHT